MSDRTHVVIGIITNAQNHILVAKRHTDKVGGGLWEFPGGKVEAGEAAYSALCRELKEEVNITVESASPFLKKPQDYPTYSVLLDVWRVDQFSEEVLGAEGQPIRWVSLEVLQTLPMPAGNKEIIAKLLESTKH